MKHAQHIRRHGYTLFEVLIAVLLLAIFSPIVAELCRTNGRSISDVNNRSAIVRETGFMTSMLASDFGAATTFLVPGDGSLHLQEYASPFSASQKEIVYARDENNCLWRSDAGVGQTNMVASCVTAFDPTVMPDGTTVRLAITMGRCGSQRSLVFMGAVP
jgi:prepilin-type N-terminal cleavage/methylation domain-containing protein